MAATESSTRAVAALDDLYRRHVGDVYRYTYAVLGNHADAEDVTQTTFVNALRALERGEQPREASHWLLAIAHNLVRQRWRQAATRPAMVELVHDVPDSTTEDDDVRLDELVRALQGIPHSQREALVMRELEGRSYKEIAELLGLSTSALETLLFRARRSLAEELENLVTCQSAELALSRQSDGRISRKDRKRLDAHLAECPSCARFSRSQAWQRKAFKGLAVLPVPVGISLFRDAPMATAGTVTAIGEAGATTAGGGTTAGAGIGTGAAGGGAAGGSITLGGSVAGSTLLGGAAAKVAAVVAAASVAVGVGYQGVKALGVEAPSRQAPASAPTKKSHDAGAAGSSAIGAAPWLGRAATAAAAGSGTTEVQTSSAPISRTGPLPVGPDAEDQAPRDDGVATGTRAGPDAGSSSPGASDSPGTSPGNDGTQGGGAGSGPGAPPGGSPGEAPPSSPPVDGAAPTGEQEPPASGSGSKPTSTTPKPVIPKANAPKVKPKPKKLKPRKAAPTSASPNTKDAATPKATGKPDGKDSAATAPSHEPKVKEPNEKAPKATEKEPNANKPPVTPPGSPQAGPPAPAPTPEGAATAAAPPVLPAGLPEAAAAGQAMGNGHGAAARTDMLGKP